MFRQSNQSSPPELFAGISHHLNRRKLKQLEDEDSWHHSFYREITSEIEESIFSLTVA